MNTPTIRRRPTDPEELGDGPLPPECGDDLLNRHGADMSEVRTACQPEIGGGVRSSRATDASGSDTLPNMVKIVRADVVRRIRAVREELGLEPPEMAARLNTARTTYLNWEAINPAKPNYPGKEAMAAIRELIPGLTLDYLYLGNLDAVPMALAIRLTARELGLDPDSADGRQAATAALASRSK